MLMATLSRGEFMTDNATPRPRRSTAGTKRRFVELRARVISAAVLASVAIASLFAGQAAFSIVVCLVAVAMAWEWGRVVRQAAWDEAALLHAVALVIAVFLALSGSVLTAFAAVIVGCAAIAARSRDVLSALGVPYIGIAAVGLVWLRLDQDWGVAAILFVFCCVWAHDTFAMLVGRAVGGPRLWPRISPNKTWAGLAGGLLASVGVGIATHLLVSGTDLYWLAFLGFVLGAASVLGDLAESALKRVHGLRHASGLIPGHGGFLDRMDGAIAAIAVAVVVAASIDAAKPGSSLLFGAAV